MASVNISGDVSGAISIAAPSAAGSGVLTLPTGTDTLVGKATTDTLTNKTLVAPALGTPASGVLTNCTGVVAGALPAGSVLQVVTGSLSSLASTSSTSFVDTGLTVSITPRSVTSRIFIAASVNGISCGTAANFVYNISNGSNTNLFSIVSNNITANAGTSASASIIDSPATTSACIYKVRFKIASSTAYINNYTGANGDTGSTITVMEIQG